MDEGSDRRWWRAVEFANRQHGIITSQQLRACGIGRGAVEKAVLRGRLHRRHVGVFSLGHVPPARPAALMAAVLACGDGALLGWRSEADHLDLRRGVGPRIDVVVPRHAGERPGIAPHRSVIHPDDIWEHDGIPMTSPARLFVDLSRIVPAHELWYALGRAAHKDLLDIGAAQEACERRPSRTLRALLGDLAITDSVLESEFLAFCDAWQIPRPKTRERLAGYRLDFVWPDHKLVVETDGWRTHKSRFAFQADRTRSNRLQVQGYLVLRFTAADIRNRSSRTADLIRAGLCRIVHP